MAPGVRASKRVRASQGSQVQPPESQTRSSKRFLVSARDGQNVEDPTNGHDETPPQRSYTDAEEGDGAGGQDNTAAEEFSGGGAQDSTGADEDNAAGEEDTEGKLMFLCHSIMPSGLLICMKLKHLNPNCILQLLHSEPQGDPGHPPREHSWTG